MPQDRQPGDQPQDELQDALRELERIEQRRAAAPVPDQRSQQDLQAAVREIAEQQKEEVARRPRGPSRAARLKWPALAIATLAVVVACAIMFWPEPLPPPAQSATEAVEGFWREIIAGKYQAATVYLHPSFVDKYGSRQQAANYLRQTFSGNPPTVVRNVKLSEDHLPDSTSLRVDYEVILRNSRPMTGPAVVVNTGDPKQGYVIVSGI